jgi:hypothetical protein
MRRLVWRFINNDVVFWVFLIILSLIMGAYILKKEDIKITITFSEPYNNRVINITGD